VDQNAVKIEDHRNLPPYSLVHGDENNMRRSTLPWYPVAKTCLLRRYNQGTRAISATCAS
jgi:hypothetical protein